MSTIWTIGHSTKPAEEMLERLQGYGIDRLIDVRTKPFSRWNPQFNKDQLCLFLAANDINYDWRGLNLGGLGKNVGYSQNIDNVIALSQTENIVLMCSEGDFRKCHRFSILAPDLTSRGAEIRHIGYENVRDVTTDLRLL